jgi:hypothetical protein
MYLKSFFDIEENIICGKMQKNNGL